MRSLSIVVVGDQKVGKTDLIFRYKDNSFLDKPERTHFDVYSKVTSLKNGEDILVNLWDTAGIFL